MSHYSNNSNNNSSGNSAANSWQSRPNNASSAASLFGQHDLGGVNPYAVAGANSSMGANAAAAAYNPAAASLLAQFAVNGVNFSSLAANLPATLLNSSLLNSTALGVANSTAQSKRNFPFA